MINPPNLQGSVAGSKEALEAAFTAGLTHMIRRETFDRRVALAVIEAYLEATGKSHSSPETLATSTASATTLPPGAEGELVERIRRAIEVETINLPMKASTVTIETLRRAADLITTLSTTIEALKGTLDIRQQESIRQGLMIGTLNDRIAGLEEESAGRLRLANDCAVAAASAGERAAKLEEALKLAVPQLKAMGGRTAGAPRALEAASRALSETETAEGK